MNQSFFIVKQSVMPNPMSNSRSGSRWLPVSYTWTVPAAAIKSWVMPDMWLPCPSLGIIVIRHETWCISWGQVLSYQIPSATLGSDQQWQSRKVREVSGQESQHYPASQLVLLPCFLLIPENVKSRFERVADPVNSPSPEWVPGCSSCV